MTLDEIKQYKFETEIERLNKEGRELAAITRQQGLEIERLRGVLADIKCGAVNITMAKQMAARALEPMP